MTFFPGTVDFQTRFFSIQIFSKCDLPFGRKFISFSHGWESTISLFWVHLKLQTRYVNPLRTYIRPYHRKTKFRFRNSINVWVNIGWLLWVSFSNEAYFQETKLHRLHNTKLTQHKTYIFKTTNFLLGYDLYPNIIICITF